MKICSTCGVEHDDAAALCRICADERQWIPADGQHWTTLDELVGAGHSIAVRELEPDLFGLTVEPSFAIGQRSHLIRTPAGAVLWDLVGYVDDAVVRRIREIGEVVAIVPSHPHHFGVQVEWSRALGGVPVMVSEADLEWVARPDPVIRTWAGKLDVLPGVTVRQVGGHFPGSAVLHWAAGADGAGALFSADTIHGNPDHGSVTFMRSYPNRIPLSAAVVQRIAASVEEFEFDRLYDNVGKIIGPNAREIIRRSADRYTGWVRGDFDHLT
ncbi:MBL fold metallo-hydrolase [Nocardia pseudobrasiliensis]|uniref:Metallo-beta-lactamase superfamily protein n=1 Tax=Nocardia pseudobrasiliensis TaxID=45979 RepID=A0A370IEI1_9NOCA|nr:MBL fold metallo-hydrolase [Nocardia pseudobrasiliensis]RDI69129.1 metallo-beta-lactamase superfamily protein [Nocardia pseudobrasiliensis]